MNCEEFEQIVDDVARGNGVVSPWQSGLAHAQGCARCAALLEETRTLHATLRGLAANDSERMAPGYLEMSLRHSFRRNRIVVAHRRRFRSWAATGGVLAAAAVVLLAVILSLRHGVTAPVRVANQDSQASGAVTPPAVKPAAPVESTPASGVRAATAVALATTHAAPRQKARTSDGDWVAEWATEFVQLPDADDLVPLESGSIVRVTMTPSALVSFGFPVSADQANTQLAADLLVDQAGMPRAIRLVR
ncbi:MAG: hypothetical protein WBC04_04850 [Candidatus Acidiferrales bacterium]